MFAYDLNVIDFFIRNPFLDGTYIYRDLWYDAHGIVIQMDLRHSTLRRHIGPDTMINQDAWFRIMYGIVDRLVFAHENDKVHGDLKPSNGTPKIHGLLMTLAVLIDLHHGRFQSNLVYLTDFGIRARSHVASGNLVEGTLSYLAPERLMEWRPTKESDMWAVGCIGYEMCIARQLSYNRYAIDSVIGGEELDLSEVDDQTYGDDIKNIIRRCLQRNPDDRCSARQLRDHIDSLFA